MARARTVTSGFTRGVSRYEGLIGTDDRKQFALLTLLHAVCTEAVQGLQIADNPVDGDMLADLERMVERTRRELEAIAGRLAADSDPFDNPS